jgi:hypothetical protein
MLLGQLAIYALFVYTEKHNAENAILANAIMLQMVIKTNAISS